MPKVQSTGAHRQQWTKVGRIERQFMNQPDFIMDIMDGNGMKSQSRSPEKKMKGRMDLQ